MQDFQQMLEAEMSIKQHNELVSKHRNIPNVAAITGDMWAMLIAARNELNNMEGVGV